MTATKQLAQQAPYYDTDKCPIVIPKQLRSGDTSVIVNN